MTPTQGLSTTQAPVEFDPFSEVFFQNPYPTYQRMRDEAPVYYNEKYGFWALTRYDDVAEASKDFETYSSARGIELSQLTSNEPPPPLMIMMDPPDHNRLRTLVSKVFTPRAISALEPMVREVVEGDLAACDGNSFDAVQDFSALFPVEIITRMLGVPDQDRQKVRLWLDRTLHREQGQMDISEDGMAAAIESGTMYYNLIVAKRDDPGDDMLSRLIAAEVERPDGSRTSLDDIEIAGFASLLGGAGAETVTKLIGNAVVLFDEHPEQWQKVLDDPAAIPGAIEEVLRIYPPAQYVGRCTTRDVTLHGVTIPAGAPVLLVIGAATRDERAFEDPDRFDISRVQLQNLGFGYGVHSCLGAALARMESRLALDALRRRTPRFTVDRARLQRVTMTNVAGYSHVPITVQS